MKKSNRTNLVSRLNDALLEMYHNATPTYPSLESDYEQDIFNSWFQDITSFEIDEMEHDPVVGYFVKRYGPLYTHGRGGRTLAPNKLVLRRGASFRMAQVEDLDLTPLEARKLLKDVNEFNRAVVAWNKSVPEMWKESVEANGWDEEIEANKNKRRKQVTVYR